VHEETVALSRQTQRLMLECAWTEPTANGGTSALHRRIVPFDELTLDPLTQRAYYFDYESRRRQLSDAKHTEAAKLRNEIEARFGRSGLRNEHAK
jgi:hypothetical protein